MSRERVAGMRLAAIAAGREQDELVKFDNLSEASAER